MAHRPESATDDVLTARYGQETIAAVRPFQPLSFDRRLAVRDALDPAFTNTWLNYAAGLYRRKHLDMRTRVLVLTGQFTMTRHYDRLRETVVYAVWEGLELREVLEAILQCFVHGGEVILDGALEVFMSVLEEYDQLDKLQATQLPPEGRDNERDLDAERANWDAADAADPRLQPLLDKYGWLGVSNALRLRPKWALDLIEFLDGVDEEFTQLWLDATYHRMYSRQVLDDKTRLLCMIGGLLAVGETTQSRRHMVGALRHGARPQEILEIAFMGCLLFGHPHNLGGAVKDFMKILTAEQGTEDVQQYPGCHRR